MDAVASHSKRWQVACRGAVPSDVAPPRNPESLQSASASLAIPTAISLAAFTQRVLVEASRSQFGAHIPPNWLPAGLPIPAAISFAPLSQRILVFAGEPQLLATSTSTIHSDASRSNLYGLRKGRNRNYKKSGCRRGGKRIFAHSIHLDPSRCLVPVDCLAAIDHAKSGISFRRKCTKVYL